jgi:hypothetical protein
VRTAIAALTLLVIASGAQGSESDAMAKAAGGFYAAYSTFHPSDGIPDEKGRARYAPFISEGLNALLAQAQAAQDKFMRANKDSPPLIEGDIFTSLYEGATSYKIGACAGDAKTGHCAIALTYDPGAPGDTRNKPVHWTDTVYLVNTPSGWKLDDIGFGGNWDFANRGRMRQTLAVAVKAAGG